MGTQRAWYLKILLVLPIALEVQSRFIDFKPGYEYVYSFEGHSTVKDLGKFIVKAKVRDKDFVYKWFFILFDYFVLFKIFVYDIIKEIKFKMLRLNFFKFKIFDKLKCTII